MRSPTVPLMDSGSEPSPSIAAPWRAALEEFDRDLGRRAVAVNTRRAYSIDSEQFADWASSHGLEPHTIDVRALRRYAAGLSERASWRRCEACSAFRCRAARAPRTLPSC